MNRIIIAAIVIIIAACVGLYFWTEWEIARFDASLPKPPVPAQETDAAHADSHEGHTPGPGEHESEDRVLAPVETPPDPIPGIPLAPELSSEEQAIRDQQWEDWAKAYRDEWGDEPSLDGEYRHIWDEHGYARRQYWDKPVLTHYDITTGFAPGPTELQRYMNLLFAHRRAERASDTQLAGQLRADMRDIVAANQGEIPVQPFGYVYQGVPRTLEESKPLREEAARELYEFLGVGHLYEFYNADPVEIKGGY